MNSRFEQAITAGVLAGTIALAGCSAGGGTEGDGGGSGPALESAVAYLDLGGGGGGGGKGALLPEVDGAPEQGNTVELTFSEAVQVGDAEAAASAFLLAESVATRVQTDTSTWMSCTGSSTPEGCTGESVQYSSPIYAFQAPFGACVSAEGTLAEQCNTQRAGYFLSTMEPTARVSEDDPRILILDYEAAGGFSVQQLHGSGESIVLAFRLRYTEGDTRPVQNLDGDALASFNFPAADQSGNVDLALVGGDETSGCQQEVCLFGLSRPIP